ncbi:MAG: recombinase family protein [Acidobacteriota bacterium]
MRGHDKIRRQHQARKACVYVRQSSPGQVLNHPESGRRQRQLETMVARWGWPPSGIEVLDEDQGKSGQSGSDREAFKRLVGEVSVGEVGIVVGLEVSRLARNNADWFPLIEMCSLTHTLVADEEGIYDPNDPNDRLVLGVKGTLSEAEVVRIRARLHGARWSLAQRGELRRKIPTGYAWDERGRVVLDPDERVRSAIRDLFARFEQIGSACGVVRSYARDGLLFPGRDFRSRWDGPVRWRALGIRQANRILHNPFYAGVYFYGERRAVTILDPQTRSRKTVVRHQPREDWEVFLPEAHPGYITYRQFLGNQERLRNNCPQKQGPGAVRSGAALLQGIVYCSRCDRRLHVRYQGGRPHPVYICARLTSIGRHVYCMSVPVQRVDRWVEQQVLEAVGPLGLEAALEAVAELQRRSEQLKRQWQHRLEQAEYEAALARRRYEAVDPDNRLVAANLEGEWEEKLRSVEELRQEYAGRAARPPMRISDEDRQRLRQLAQDLPGLWHAETTKPSDRARLVRILIRDVWLSQEDEPRRTRVRIHWQTGAVTEGLVARPLPACDAVRTPEAVVQRVRELWASCRSAEEIAERLNREGLRSGRSKAFTARRVKYLLRSRNIPGPGEGPQK